MSNLPDFRIDGRWIRSHRGGKFPVDPYVPYGYFHEKEPSVRGSIEEVNTVLLTNRECPFSCLMCDLWQHTTDDPVPAGAIPAQIDYALSRLPEASLLKLYNSGSFFDPHAIPVADYPGIARLSETYSLLLVESHPAFLGTHCLDFHRLLAPRLEVAIGLETVHPKVLKRLNKQMTLDAFERGVEFLGRHGISTRAFILLRPPFLSEEEGVEWACRSIDFAFQAGAGVCSVIPVRSGNGAMDALVREGLHREPSLDSLEKALEYGIGLGKGRVFADLWDLERFSGCHKCFEARRSRLEKQNLYQEKLAPIVCDCT
jgi:radical SAM enzyme (TIGR01210 family)